jgi:hypothetical protein
VSENPRQSPAARIREEVVIRGVIDTIWAHGYQLSADETAELRKLLEPYWAEDVIDDVHLAAGFLAHPADEADLDHAANHLREYLLAHLATIEEKLELEEAQRDAYDDLRRALGEDSGDPSPVGDVGGSDDGGAS